MNAPLRITLDMSWLDARTLVNCLRAPAENDFSVPGCGCGSERWRVGKNEGCHVHDVRLRYTEMADLIMAQIGDKEP